MGHYELLVLAHRYLYYVLSTPVIDDQEYDKLEARARLTAADDSPVHDVGSDLESSYSEEVKAKAKQLTQKLEE